MPIGLKRVKKKAGLQPGAVVWSGPERTHQVIASCISYRDGSVRECTGVPLDDILASLDHHAVTWIDINGIHDTNLVERLGNQFGLHPLVLEDIVTTGQRPKLEDYENYFFLTIKGLALDKEHRAVIVEEISIIFGRNFVLSFQEFEKDTFRPVKDRLLKGTERFLKSGPDYLAYALVDMIVDNYFTVLEEIGDMFEELQNQVLAAPSPTTLKTVYRLKNDLLLLRRAVWPLREAIAAWQRHETDLVSRTTEIYLRDVQDHTVQVMDAIETLRDMLSGTIDVYLSSISNRLNTVMKVLTIIATIFIPLTFIAGVYGMNFDYMPELRWRYGYPTIMAIMFLAGAGMLWWFRRNKWL